ncbi:MAG: glycerol-3-phosphate dehydrogenase [Myxococcales bacterium]|nr:glycerol-3-phosphate dehydrogenase [Myxococcales bacterium]
MIIGGGIVGCGAARDAAMRGLKVVLVDASDIASGTSSRSSKLVHGGLRYLEQGEFSLVFEAVSERRVLMDIAPHLVHPLGFVFPVYKRSRHGVFTVNLGMWLYDGLSLFRSPKIHRNLSTAEVAKEEPALDQKELKGAPLYYDCSTDDARLTLENALDARAEGAEIHTWTKMVGLRRDESGRVHGARVRDTLSGEERDIDARVVVNATGPWSDSVRQGPKPLLRPTKGVHIVVERTRLPVNNAVVCSHPTDGRVLFAIPWDDRTYIGTTDTDYTGDPALVAADAADVRYLLDAANSYFPASTLTEADVLSTWAGLRPLISSEGSESSVSREHEILVGSDGLITIAGGKLTTFRKMSKEVVDRAVALLRLTTGATRGSAGKGAPEYREAHTARKPLPGAQGWPEDDDVERVVKSIREAGPVDDATARLFAATYGMRGIDVASTINADPTLGTPLIEGRPERLAQVDFAVKHELAKTIRDILIRRTQLYYRDHDQGLGATDLVADRMATLCGWDDARKTAEVEAWREEVSRSRAWKTVSA